MALAMLDSEKGKLIYKFLYDTKQTLGNKFLNTFKPLEECRLMLRNGKRCNMKLQDFTLMDVIDKDSELRSLVSQMTKDKGPVLGNYINDLKSILSTFVQLRSNSSRVHNVDDNSRIESSNVSPPNLNDNKSCNSEHGIVTVNDIEPELSGSPFRSTSPDSNIVNNEKELTDSPPRSNCNEVLPCSFSRPTSANINKIYDTRSELLNASPSASPSSSVKINSVITEPANIYSAQPSANISEQFSSYSLSNSDVTKVDDVRAKPFNASRFEPRNTESETSIQPFVPNSSFETVRLYGCSPGEQMLTDTGDEIVNEPRNSDIPTDGAKTAPVNTEINSLVLNGCSELEYSAETNTATTEKSLLTDVNRTDLVKHLTNSTEITFTDITVAQPPVTSMKITKNHTLSRGAQLETESASEGVKRGLPWDMTLRQRIGPEELLTAGCTKRKYNTKASKKTPKKRKVNDNDALEDAKKVKIDIGRTKFADRLNLDVDEKRSEKLKSQSVTRKKRATKNNVAADEDRKFGSKQDAEEVNKIKKKKVEKPSTSGKGKIGKNAEADEKQNEPSNEPENNEVNYDERSNETIVPLVLTYTEEFVLFDKESIVESAFLLNTVFRAASPVRI